MTASLPSGESLASEISVEFRYSSSVIAGLADCAREREETARRKRKARKSRRRIRKIYPGSSPFGRPATCDNRCHHASARCPPALLAIQFRALRVDQRPDGGP